MADALRGPMDAAECKHVVLDLTFLMYISDAVEERDIRPDAKRNQSADPKDPDEYPAKNSNIVHSRRISDYWVHPSCSHLFSCASAEC